MQQITDIEYRPICIGRNDYRYLYIGFADMGYIGRYFTSADTDMPTLVKAHEGVIHAKIRQRETIQYTARGSDYWTCLNATLHSGLGEIITHT